MADVLPFAGDLGSLFAGIAALWAVSQVHQWRKQNKAVTRSQVATDLMACALEASLALEDVRARRIERVPEDTEEANKLPNVLSGRLDTLSRSAEIFRVLRAAEIRHNVLIGGDEVKEAVEELFRVRRDVQNAILSCIRYSSIDGSENQHNEPMAQLLFVIIASLPETDEIQSRIDKAIQTLEKHLTPQARLDV